MLNRRALLNAREYGPSSDDDFTAAELVAAQDALEADARESIPFKFDRCSYDMGYVRQSVWACQTCPGTPGVCAGCSVVCHGDHQLVELFSKRHFRCDCGTKRINDTALCTLATRKGAPVNDQNKYDKNFRDKFCICNKSYDPDTEDSVMYQCISCEDWFHSTCLLKPNGPPLSQDDFDMLICAQCSTKNDRVKAFVELYAGFEGTGVMVINESASNKVLGKLPPQSKDHAASSSSSAAGLSSPAQLGKRPSQEESAREHDSSAKKSKMDIEMTPGPCKAPGRGRPAAEQPLNSLSLSQAVPVYLDEGWRERWCRCKECMPLYEHLPWVLEEEETWEPPLDLEARHSTFELGMDALDKLPRPQILEGVMAYQGFSARLKEYLKPFADRGETVTKDKIEQFFDLERERRADIHQQFREAQR